MQRFYSNGKLLLTGEYVVLDESQSLALPTKLGQDLIIKKSNQKGLQWIAKNEKDIIWFEAFFDLEKFRLESATYHDSEDRPDIIADTLMQVLQEAKKMNSKFLQLETGLCVETNLSFPRTWGLGSSSTFINNVASWSNVNAFELLPSTQAISGQVTAAASEVEHGFASVQLAHTMMGRKIVNEISLPTFIAVTASLSLWLVYGIIVNSIAMIVSNILTLAFIIAITLGVYRIRSKRSEDELNKPTSSSR